MSRLSQYKRKRFWVDASLQLQMLGYVLGLVVATLLLVSFSVVHGLTQASLESHQLVHTLDWIRLTLRGPLAVSSCVAILATGLLTVIWSHRFAGPLRVLAAGMGRLRQGNFTSEPRIRGTDALQETVRDFAQMQGGLRELLAKDREHLDAAVARLEALAHKTSSESERRELHSVAADLKSLHKHLHL